jgi:chromosome segregation ATPase
MAVMAREAWTDERLDDLNKKVDDGFREMREEFRAVRGEMQGLRGEIQGVRDEIAVMSRNLMQLTWGLIGTMLVGFLGTIVALVTQT